MFMMKKPIIDGFQYGVDEEPEWLFGKDLLSKVYVRTESTFREEIETKIFLEIETKNFHQQAKYGDYVIRISNELFVIPRQLFGKLFYKI